MSKNKKITDLKYDKRNANKHSDSGMQMLRDGIIKNGLGRSILLSSDDEIIAGNGVAETAQNIGIQNVKVIETDGTEIIAVKRTDIKSGTKEFYEMALSDNIIAKVNIIMDAEVVNAICEDYDIEEFKIDENIEKINKRLEETSLLKQSVQLIPGKEYVLIMAEEDSSEWEEVKQILELQIVKRGGVKDGSPYNVHKGIERCITAIRLLYACRNTK